MARLFLAFMVLLGLAMAATAARPATSTADDPGDCNSDVQGLINNCQAYVMPPDNPKIDPSDACCSVIQNANIPCLCSKVTPAVEALISMDKVVYVLKSCNRPLQPGSQCGSYHVPGGLA